MTLMLPPSLGLYEPGHVVTIDLG